MAREGFGDGLDGGGVGSGGGAVEGCQIVEAHRGEAAGARGGGEKVDMGHG